MASYLKAQAQSSIPISNTKPLVRWAGTEMAQAHSFLLELVPPGLPPDLPRLQVKNFILYVRRSFYLGKPQGLS